MFNTLGNASYLACSWLWCLGGFFPLLLMRDYGWPALLAFTVFNVGGAMAMGYCFTNKTAQHAFVERHKTAIHWFSYVTMAYQIFFVIWLSAVTQQSWIILATLALLSAIYMSKQAIKAWSFFILILSLSLFAWFVANINIAVDLSAKEAWPHSIIPLAIGFVLSPYLDITFHRAFRDSNSPRATFSMGFGCFFLTLIVFVFIYAEALGKVFFEGQAINALALPIILFLVIQTVFTLAAHLDELQLQRKVKLKKLASIFFLLSLVFIAIVYGLFDTKLPDLNIAVNETIYKAFLFFYSLVFPLYLLLHKQNNIFLLTLAAATPAYAIGFLIGGTWSFTLSIGVGAILLGVALSKIPNMTQKTL